MAIEKICCMGAGFVGVTTSAVIASKCPDLKIEVVAPHHSTIDKWNSDEPPVFETGLKDLVISCRDKNLTFSTDIDRAVEEADLIFLCVKTPPKTSGAGEGRTADLQYLEEAVMKIAKVCTKSKIVVERSTVPVRAAQLIADILKNNAKEGVKFEVISNPEFLTRGRAVNFCLDPHHRILIGCAETDEAKSAASALSSIYERWVPKEKIITMDNWSAELTKLAQSCFMAQRLCNMNALSAICEKVGADISHLEEGLGSYSVIGPERLKAGLGFGGSSLEKDVLQMEYMCECLGLPEVAKYWGQVMDINSYQKNRFVSLILEHYGDSLKEKTIGIYAVVHNAGAKGTRSSAAMSVCRKLLEAGAHLRIYCPHGESPEIYKDLEDNTSHDEDTVKKMVSIHPCPYKTSVGCSALVMCVGWEELKTLDYEEIYQQNMSHPACVFDGRVVLDHHALIEIGLHVECIGRVLPNSSDGNGHVVNTDYLDPAM